MSSIRERLEAIEADITTLSYDAIVNAANSALMPGGGVDGAIRRKAGPELTERLYRIGRCEEGEAIITPGFRLPAKHVIHTVAPIWNGEDSDTQVSTLARCYANSLRLADEHSIRSIAFPCIGTGIYGWPSDLAGDIAFHEVTKHLRTSSVQTMVTFCCFSQADKARYAELIAWMKD